MPVTDRFEVPNLAGSGKGAAINASGIGAHAVRMRVPAVMPPWVEAGRPEVQMVLMIHIRRVQSRTSTIEEESAVGISLVADVHMKRLEPRIKAHGWLGRQSKWHRDA